MAITIYHTADNHIGRSFNHYPDAARERLTEERFAALQRMVADANHRSAHFFVVAGDLFDKQTVAVRDIKRTVKILAGFDGEAVLVLAGNHDYYEGDDNKLWKAFGQAAEGTAVLALTEPRTFDFEVGQERVRFYACPCPSKHGADSMIGWVEEEEKEEGMLHIGLAHGNVDGLGMDDDHRYFNMTVKALEEAGLHTWLLGHIHVPAPDPGTTGLPVFFMPGIHTPDSVKCTHPGHAWWIELEADGTCRHELCTTGAIRFVRMKRCMLHADDITSLQQECDGLDAPNTVLDLQLVGTLPEEDLRTLTRWLNKLPARFLHATDERDITALLSPETIAKQFVENTLQHALLTELLADTEHQGDAQVALELIDQIH